MLLLCLVMALLAPVPAALANGNRVKIFLGYVPGISNWGAYEANGEASLDPSQGQVHLVVNHLPHQPDVQYQAWVVPAEDQTTMISLGSFRVDASGHAEVDLSRADLHTREYRFLVITAEPVPDEDPAPDPRRALAGVFPNLKAVPAPEDSQAFADLLDESSIPPADGPEASVSPKSSGAGAARPQRDGSPPPLTLPVTGAGLGAGPVWQAAALAAGLLAATLAHIARALAQTRRTGGEE